MISERAAKSAILQLWRTWGARTGRTSDMRAFYDWLQAEHPPLLTFKSDRNKWEVVRLWLLGR
jgi:hypothetical protein